MDIFLEYKFYEIKSVIKKLNTVVAVKRILLYPYFKKPILNIIKCLYVKFTAENKFMFIVRSCFDINLPSYIHIPRIQARCYSNKNIVAGRSYL